MHKVADIAAGVRPGAFVCTLTRNNTHWKHNLPNRCIDVQFGEGPVIQLTSCKHAPTSHDPVEIAYIRKQMFTYDRGTRQLRTMPVRRTLIRETSRTQASREMPILVLSDDFQSVQADLVTVSTLSP